MRKYDNHFNEEIKRAVKFDGILESLRCHYNLINLNKIDRHTIFDALFILQEDKYNLEHPGDLWAIEIEYDEALKLLENFDFNVILNSIETQENIIPKEFLLEFKVKVKSKGLVWIIHKYDSDPFPSNPHAHQLDNNIKLDLSNGKCYKGKRYFYTIKTKELLEIRDAASKVFDGELPKLAI